MANLLDDWQKLTQTLEQAEKRKARVEGALEQLASRLQSEFGLNSDIEEIQDEINRIEREEKQLEKEFGPKLKSFLKRYGEELND